MVDSLCDALTPQASLWAASVSGGSPPLFAGLADSAAETAAAKEPFPPALKLPDSFIARVVSLSAALPAGIGRECAESGVGSEVSPCGVLFLPSGELVPFPDRYAVGGADLDLRGSQPRLDRRSLGDA